MSDEHEDIPASDARVDMDMLHDLLKRARARIDAGTDTTDDHRMVEKVTKWLDRYEKEEGTV